MKIDIDTVIETNKSHDMSIVSSVSDVCQWGVVKKLFLLALPKSGTVELNWSMNLLQIKNSFHLCAHIKIQHKEGKEIA